MIKRFIEIANECILLNNFNSATEIISGNYRYIYHSFDSLFNVSTNDSLFMNINDRTQFFRCSSVTQNLGIDWTRQFFPNGINPNDHLPNKILQTIPRNAPQVRVPSPALYIILVSLLNALSEYIAIVWLGPAFLIQGYI